MAMKLIENNIQKIFELCKKYRVKTLSVFGSILTDRFNERSDVDLLVTFQPYDPDNPGDFDYFRNYFDLKFSLEDIFNREVDLIEEKALKNPNFIYNINRTKRLIYG